VQWIIILQIRARKKKGYFMLRRYLLLTTTLFFCFSAANISDQKPNVPPSPQKVSQQPTPPRPPVARNKKTWFGFDDQKTTVWCERLKAAAAATAAVTMSAATIGIQIPPSAPIAGPVLVGGFLGLLATWIRGKKQHKLVR
jgi:hypothetical protein